jgi:hypothetical protein
MASRIGRPGGRPAPILDRLSKSLEWDDSSRHDAKSSGGSHLELSAGTPAILRRVDPPAPRDSA